MAAQLAEQLLAVMWLDRCRQAQRLTEGQARGYREEVVRVLLASFLVEQRWGFGPNIIDDEGVVQVEGVLNFEATRPPGEHVDHFAEQLIMARLVVDVQLGQWTTPNEYMRGAEFFGGFPRGSLRRLTPGAASR